MNAEKKTATNVKQAVPFFHVSNMEESLRYYVEGLGFEMTRKWIDEGKLRWCWLEIGDAALMLQEDPDGYRIDFESPTNVPEDTEYSPQLH
jgi:catechol 2,3-dioxygenase-like lactoylglutathione lyase family enzyme